MDEMSDAEVFGNNAPPTPVRFGAPSGAMGEMSDADVFGPAIPPTTSPAASTSASPSSELSDAQVFSGTGSQHYSATRGLVSGFAQQYPESMGQTLEGLSYLAPSYFKDSLQRGSQSLIGTQAPAGYELQGKKLQDIWNDPNLSDALTWAGETFGQGAASTAAPIALGTAGGTIGTAVAPGVGTAVGAGTGAVLGGSFQNYGEVYKALKDAGVEPERAAKLGAAVLPILSGLDAVGMLPGAAALSAPIKKLVTKAIVDRVAVEAAKQGGESFGKRVGVEAIKSAGSEGLTEGLQEFTKQATISAETGKPLFTKENAWDILENALGGALVGGPFGAGASAIGGKEGVSTEKKPYVAPTPEEVYAAFADYKPESSTAFNDQQLDVLRRMVNTNRDPFVPEGATEAPLGQAMASAAAPSTEQTGPGPLWFSKAEQVAETLPESGTATQMRNEMRNKGVRLDELTWTGLDELFHSKGADIQAVPLDTLGQTVDGRPSAVLQLENWKIENWGNLQPGERRPPPPKELIAAAQAEKADLQKRKGEVARQQSQSSVVQKVTKQEILNHLRENRYVLKEQIRDDMNAPLTAEERALSDEQGQIASRVDELNTILDGNETQAPLSNWAQREPLLAEWNALYDRLHQINQRLNSIPKGPKPEYSSYVVPGERRGYATLALQVPETEDILDHALSNDLFTDDSEMARIRGYNPPHFYSDTEAEKGYRNTIAHARITLREDNSGHLTAHIEELQSDWHQIARKEGYLSKEIVSDMIASFALQNAAYTDLMSYFRSLTGNDNSGRWVEQRTRWGVSEADTSGAEVLADRMQAIVGGRAKEVIMNYALAHAARDKISTRVENAVADAPYKMTQDWTRLMMRRILRWAADRGIERITWNNPELAFQYPTGNGGLQSMTDMGPKKKKQWEGMKKHYGQTIPGIARELARQYGGDVGVTQIRVSNVGPWVTAPFVANGVITGWGFSRWEGQPGNMAPTSPFPTGVGNQRTGYKRSYASEAEARSVLFEMKSKGFLTDLNVLRYSNEVMYLDFDKRAQWNFQRTGFPSFMLDPTAEKVDRPGQKFEVYESKSLRDIPAQNRGPLLTQAHQLINAFEKVAARFGMDQRMSVTLLGTRQDAAKYIQGSAAYHSYDPATKTHAFYVNMAYYAQLPVNDGVKVTALWSDMMHEFGHAIQWEYFDKLPGPTKIAIRGAYEKFLTDANKVFTLQQKLDFRMSAANVLALSKATAVKSWNSLPQAEREYWVSFNEWFADQVSRWGTTDEAPLTVVDKALKGLRDMLVAIWKMVSKQLGLNFEAEPMIAEFLNRFMKEDVGFGPVQYLEHDSKQVIKDKMAIASEERDMFVPERSEVADTIYQSAMAVAAVMPPGPGPASSAVHASRINFMYKYMGGLAHLAEANPSFAPLIRYTERIRRMHLDETNIHDAAIRIRKEWRALGVQAENLTAFINDLVNLDFLSPAEKAAGVVRHPSPAEQSALVAKHRLSSEGLKVFGKIKILNDWLLDLTAQSAMKSAMRSISDPAKLMTKIDEITIRTAALKGRPFFPFMRFGRHYVIAKDAAGNTLHFETFERIGLRSAERQQNARSDELAVQFPGAKIDTGVLPEAAAPFVGLPPMLLEEIRDKLTLTPSQIDALENLMYQHSTATKFPKAFKQNYIKGYSMDFQRSFARYFFYAGKYYARAEHSWELNDDIREAGAVGGNTATKIRNFMSDHLKNTVLEAKGDFGLLKGGIFLWAMGYVPAAATQNLTQTPMITFPYLAAKFGDIKATKAMVNAMRQFSSFYRRGSYEKTGNLEMEALDYGIKKGIITESQASELAAAAQGMNLLKGIGGNIAQRGWQAFMEKSAWMFEMAEQVNRRIAYRAAYNLALENPNAPIVREAIDAYKGEYANLGRTSGNPAWAKAVITASYVTTKTQYEYARWARPRIMRGRLPGTLFVFKTYMLNTLWMLANNKSDVLPRFLLISALMGGLSGIPGYDDLKDLLKAIGRWMNKDFDVEKALREHLTSHYDGKIPPDMIIGGLARRGYGIPALLDLMGSFATGTPGRGFDGKVAGQNVPFPVLDRHRAITLGPLLPVELGKMLTPTDDLNRTIAEQSQRASGAVFSVGFNIYKAIMDNKLEATDWKRWERAIPRELGDLTRTWRAFNEGRERSRGGPQSAPTIAEFNWRDSEQAGEMLAMALGYQPLRVQAKWDSIMAKVEVEKFFEMQQKTLFGQLFEARKGGNPKEIEDVLESIRRFNRELPPIARGYTITQDNATKSIQGRERELIARERGIPTQKRNIPLSQHVDTLFPETTVDVRRVK